MLANTFEYVYVIIPTLLHLLKVVFFVFLNKPWKGKRRYRPWKASFSVSMIKSRWYACFEDFKFESLTAECINPRDIFNVFSNLSLMGLFQEVVILKIQQLVSYLDFLPFGDPKLPKISPHLFAPLVGHECDTQFRAIVISYTVSSFGFEQPTESKIPTPRHEQKRVQLT